MQTVNLNEYFRGITAVPPSLYILGTLPPPEYKRITIVGSRRPSQYGRAATKQIIEGLRGCPVSIISGLAIGIDALVHESALSANIHTIALPGSGLSESALYPRSNAELAKRIIESGGTMLSLWEDTGAAPWTFPVRNKLMAGLADLVLIVEANENSGTMITARAARELGVPLGAVPGNIDALLSVGPNKLIQQGAHCITRGQDILDLLHITEEEYTSDAKSDQAHPLFIHLSEPLHRDVLMTRMGLTPAELNPIITLYELSGDITIDAEGIVRKRH